MCLSGRWKGNFIRVQIRHWCARRCVNGQQYPADIPVVLHRQLAFYHHSIAFASPGWTMTWLPFMTSGTSRLGNESTEGANRLWRYGVVLRSIRCRSSAGIYRTSRWTGIQPGTPVFLLIIVTVSGIPRSHSFIHMSDKTIELPPHHQQFIRRNHPGYLYNAILLQIIQSVDRWARCITRDSIGFDKSSVILAQCMQQLDIRILKTERAESLIIGNHVVCTIGKQPCPGPGLATLDGIRQCSPAAVVLLIDVGAFLE